MQMWNHLKCAIGGAVLMGGRLQSQICRLIAKPMTDTEEGMILMPSRCARCSPQKLVRVCARTMELQVMVGVVDPTALATATVTSNSSQQPRTMDRRTTLV